MTSSGNVLVDCLDIHVEVLAAGGSVPVAHRFTARPESTHSFVKGSGSPLVEGDLFENESISDHRLPKTGVSFATMPTGKGCFSNAGQTFVLVNGKPWVTLDGVLQTCSDAAPERPIKSGVVLLGKPFLLIHGSPAIFGAPTE